MKKKNSLCFGCIYGTLGQTHGEDLDRTTDPLVRRRPLYPDSHIMLLCPSV